MPKKRSSPVLPENMMMLGIYGIWSRDEKRVVYITLDKEEAEMEYDMEGYHEVTHVIVFLNAAYDVSSLEQLYQ